MLVLNLGCGTKTAPNCINLDNSPYLILKTTPILRSFGAIFLDKARRERLGQLDDTIQRCDLRKGIPYPDDSVDVVYHSHLFEHIDREQVVGFIREVRRVLRPGGIHRICTPDLEYLVEQYHRSLRQNGNGHRDWQAHDRAVADILDQCVRKEAVATSEQPPLRRWLENRFVGDARQRAETHQWLWDRVNLAGLLEQNGYHKVSVTRHSESRIPDWAGFRLEVNDDGSEYKPGSIYIEAEKTDDRKPS